MKNLFTVLFIVLTMPLAKSQDHEHNVGVKRGATSAVTYRYLKNPHQPVEFILSLDDPGLKLTVLKESFDPKIIGKSDNLMFVKGYGGHVGYTYRKSYNFFWRTYELPNREFSPFLGVDIYIALEYHVMSIPVIFGIDYNPYFEFSNNQFFRMDLFNLSFNLRYAFN